MNQPMLRRVESLLRRMLDDLDDSRPLAIPGDLGFRPAPTDGGDQVLESPRFSAHCCHRQSPVFAKLHLERATVAGGFQYLHAMCFPHPRYPLPLLGVDINAGGPRVTLAVLHLYPPVAGQSLPGHYGEALATLHRVDFARHRPLPAWGDIFQEGLCFIVQPQDTAEEQRFIELLEVLVPVYTRHSRVVTPDLAQAPATLARRQRQAHYVAQKRANDRGRRLLAANLASAALADRYVDEFLWPDPPPAPG